MARQPATVSGVWRPDSVKVRLSSSLPPEARTGPADPLTHSLRAEQDVAESLGIANLPDDVARALAGDVEYRLWDIIEASLPSLSH